MTISRVELQGQVTRAQDFTTLKQNEDNKATVDQSNFQRQFGQAVDNRAHQVNQSDHAENRQKNFDAKEEGNGTYSGDGGRNRRKGKQDQSDGKVLIKGRSGFDIKI